VESSQPYRGRDSLPADFVERSKWYRSRCAEDCSDEVGSCLYEWVERVPMAVFAIAIQQGTISAAYWETPATLRTNSYQIRGQIIFPSKGRAGRSRALGRCHDDQDCRGTVGDPVSPG